MFKATVIETFIATPSDIVQERAMIREIVDEWNIVNSKSRSATIKDLDWENDVYSSFANGRPQESINKQILENSDLLIGVFWTRIGTSTGDYISGSVEEIEKHIEADKPVMLFFSNMPVRPDSVDQEQYEKLVNFKKWCQDKGLYIPYEKVEDFIKEFRRQLGLLMNNEEKILKLIGNPVEDKTDVTQEKKISISEIASQLLKEISLDRGGQLIALKTLGGYQVQTNSKNFSADKHDARAQAEINAAIEELESYDLIRSNTKRDIFTITANGYKVADQLKMLK